MTSSSRRSTRHRDHRKRLAHRRARPGAMRARPAWLLALAGARPAAARGAQCGCPGCRSGIRSTGGTRMWMTVGEHRFAITLADTDAARAFAAQLPLTLDMAELNGNEKHADLSQALPDECESTRDDSQRRSDALRLEHAGRLLPDVQLVLLVHPPRPRGRSRWPGAGTRAAACKSRSLVEALSMQATRLDGNLATCASRNARTPRSSSPPTR